jgi:hypothetical protein
MVVLPAWLDHAPTVDFTPEKNLLVQLERWAEAHGWTVSDGSGLSSELRQRTDVLIEHPASDRRIRLAVLRKSRRGVSSIRVDASNLRTVELVFQRRQRRWRVFAGGVPIEDDVVGRGWDWLVDILFRP